MSGLETQPKTTPLISLNEEAQNNLQTQKKWSTVIDPQGQADIYFKYFCNPVMTVGDQTPDPKQLCQKLLKTAPHPKLLAINYAGNGSQDIFDAQYFPQEVLDPQWISDKHNINQLRGNFAEEFSEEIEVSPKFGLVFVANKEDNIPAVIKKKTALIEVAAPEKKSYEHRRKERAVREAKPKRKESPARETIVNEEIRVNGEERVKRAVVLPEDEEEQQETEQKGEEPKELMKKIKENEIEEEKKLEDLRQDIMELEGNVIPSRNSQNNNISRTQSLPQGQGPRDSDLLKANTPKSFIFSNELRISVNWKSSLSVYKTRRIFLQIVGFYGKYV